MRGNNQRSFINEGLDAPNDGLGIEVAIEPLIEACSDLRPRLLTLGRGDASITLLSLNRSLEVEEEKHLFASLQPPVSFKNGRSC